MKSLEGIMRESKELYRQITLIHVLKKLTLISASESEDKLHEFILNHFLRIQTNS